MVNGSERQGELEKARLANLRSQSECYQKLSDPSVETERNAALEYEGKLYETQVTAINHKHDLIAQELELRDKILGVAQSEDTEDAERLQTLKAIEESTDRRAFNAVNEEERAGADGPPKTEFAVETEQRRQFSLQNGPGGADYRQEQRDQKHARAIFDARKADFESRRARGAYGQSGPDRTRRSSVATARKARPSTISTTSPNESGTKTDLDSRKSRVITECRADNAEIGRRLRR